MIDEKLLTCCQQLDSNKTIYIAYSGGVDSAVLLRAAVNATRVTKHTLKAIHINHQLHADSQQWAQHCNDQCLALGVDFKSITVNVDACSKLGVEAAAREVRYAAFESILGADDVLFTAHHADDQIETILLRLFRGSGAQGLIGCVTQRPLGDAILIRPLLKVTRTSIEQYAEEHQISWHEDPSNADVSYDRNYLRANVLPVLHARWQGLHETVGRAAQWQVESAELLDRLARIDLNIQSDIPNPLATHLFDHLDITATKNALRWWIRAQGFPMPSAHVLSHVISDVLNSAEDAEGCVSWQGIEIRKYRHQLYLHPIYPQHDTSLSYQWDISETLKIKAINLRLSNEVLHAHGIDTHKFKKLTVRFRQGGEVISPRGRGCSKTLKALFQEEGVAPWLRDRIPLLYENDTLIFVWGYWVQEGY